MTLCERTQALSPDDREALVTILREYKNEQPRLAARATIPVREVSPSSSPRCTRALNRAMCHMREAARYMTTATWTCFGFVAVLSGTDGSLLRETVFKSIERVEKPSRFWGKIAMLLGASPPAPTQSTATIPLRISRFQGRCAYSPARSVAPS